MFEKCMGYKLSSRSPGTLLMSTKGISFQGQQEVYFGPVLIAWVDTNTDKLYCGPLLTAWVGTRTIFFSCIHCMGRQQDNILFLY
jgi:hypothetical protein